MFILKSIRKIFKILNSELSPVQVAVGFCLGIYAGLSPLGFHSVLLFLFALLLNCSFSATLFGFALFKLVAWLVVPISYEVGRLALEQIAFLEPFWTVVLNWPVLALMEYNNYVVFGSYVLATAFSIPLFFVIKSFVRKYRASFFEFLESKRPYQSLLRHEKIQRVLEWVVMGGGARFEEAERKRGPLKFLRTGGLIGIPATALLLLIVSALILTFAIDKIVIAGSSAIIGGDVKATNVSMNALTGRIEVNGLTVQDPNKSEENVIEVGKLVADIGLVELLSKRFVFDEVGVNQLSFHIRREADGSLNIDDLDESIDLAPYFDWIKNNADKVDWLQLITEYLKARIDAAENPVEPDVNQKIISQYKEIEPSEPFFAIQRFNIQQIHIRLTDEFKHEGPLPGITMVDVILENVEFPPELARAPMNVGLRAYFEDQTDSFIELSALFDEKSEPPVHTYTLEVQQLDLEPISAFYENSLPVKVQSGFGFMKSQIISRGYEISAENQLSVEKLVIQSENESGSLFGLSPQLTTSAIRGINAYAAQCPIQLGFLADGTLENLTFHWDDQLLQVAKRGLVMLGSNQFSQQIGQIDQRLESLLSLGSQLDVVEEVLGNIFSGQLGSKPEGCLEGGENESN
jgi:uncharacterized protein (TIGR03546 family)